MLAEFAKTAGKPITCNAAVAWGPNEPLKNETVEVAPPKKGEVGAVVQTTTLAWNHHHAGFSKV